MYVLLHLIGLLVRLLLIGVPGFKADVAFWKGWGLAVADKGIIWLANNTNYNYPPGFVYILYLVNKIYALFKNPYNINEYWLDTNYFYLFLIKAITIISDIGIAYLIIRFGSKLKSKWGKLLSLFFFLNIVSIFDGVIWGQVDQYGLFIFMISLYFLLIDRPNWASVFFVLSFTMKFQSIIFIPLFYLYVYKKFGYAGLIRSIGSGVIIFILVITPFWWNREMASLIRLLTINSNWFPWYSLNAFNVWWIASGLNGMAISDKTLILGVMNAKQVGLLSFSFVYLIAMLNIFFERKEDLLRELIASSVLVVFAFFHLLTQSHERYLFPILGLYLLFYFFKKEKNLNRLLIFYLLLSVGMFINIYISAALNYPDQVLWPFDLQTTRTFSLYISLYQIGVFIYFFLQYFSRFIRRRSGIIFLGGLFFLSLFFVKNINYILRRPISLTQINSISDRQDYLPPINNMTVESNRNVFAWNRLSDNYFFYEKGIGAHADSEISYGIGGRFSKFTTDFGIDTEGVESAKAYFIIEGDGRTLFKSKLQSRFDYPGVADVSIKGVKKLTLKIIRGGESNYGVHADWLDPILIR